MRTARLTAILVAASVILLSLPAAPSVADGTSTNDSTVIVTFEGSQADPAAAARAAVVAAGGERIGRIRPITGNTVAVTLKGTSAAAADEVNARLEEQSSVRAADTSARFYPTETNDTYYDYLWNLNSAAGSGYGVDAEDAWPTSTGAGVQVAVLDTGITVHSDLTGAASIVGGNVVAGYDFISDASYSGDGDGYDADPTDVVAEDDFHGTHVAGTIAAIANNGVGVAGVAPGAKVQPLRVLGYDGGSEEDIIAAIRWAAGLSVSGVASTNPTKASVINLSLGGAGRCSYALQSAINAAVAAGAAVVVAAGNGDPSGNGVAISSTMPADCANVIRVTASTKAGALAPYSNYGTSSLPATIAAPGGSGTAADWIVSTWHDPATDAEAYVGMAGTSMAAPHVSGVLALMRAVSPALTVGQLTSLLTSTARSFSASCSTARCGAGIANAPAAVAAARSLQVSRPSWSGATRVGSKLTASASVSPTSATLKWQWLRSGKAISGAKSPTYTPTAKDYHKQLSVRVTATSGGRTSTATSTTAKVKAGQFTKTAPPVVKGTFTVGRKLTAAAGKWSPNSTRTSYQWLRNGKRIKGATGKHHRLTKKDKGKSISVKVTVRRSGYATTTAVSVTYPVS